MHTFRRLGFMTGTAALMACSNAKVNERGQQIAAFEAKKSSFSQEQKSGDQIPQASQNPQEIPKDSLQSEAKGTEDPGTKPEGEAEVTPSPSPSPEKSAGPAIYAPKEGMALYADFEEPLRDRISMDELVFSPAAVLGEPKFGKKSFEIVGADNAVNYPKLNANSFQNFSVSVWVYSKVAGQALVFEVCGSGNQGLALGFNADGISYGKIMDQQGGISLFSKLKLNLNQWHNLLIKFDGTKLYLYQDGALGGQLDLTGNNLNLSPQSLKSGGNSECGLAAPSTAGFLVDDLRVYERAVNDQELELIVKGRP